MRASCPMACDATKPAVRKTRSEKRVRDPRSLFSGQNAAATQFHGLHALAMRGHKACMDARGDERSVGGYSVAYSRDDTHFPVYATAAMAAVFFASAWITGATFWLVLAVAA